MIPMITINKGMAIDIKNVEVRSGSSLMPGIIGLAKRRKRIDPVPMRISPIPKIFIIVLLFKITSPSVLCDQSAVEKGGFVFRSING